MTPTEIIELLRMKEVAYLKTKEFSKLPGIYALFYIGNNFPILGNAVTKHQIIYIGKTESSQKLRDAKTHFATGKTGSSTVRKSIGSILCSINDLIPIPRNNNDYKNGRFHHFKFDERSEKIITDWMVNNLSLSFYEYPESVDKIDELETDIIKRLKPLLNIDYKNSDNPYKVLIKKLRKNCATIAMMNSNYKEQGVEIKEQVKLKVQNNPSEGTPVSNSIHINNITDNDIKSKNLRITAENKHFFPAEKLANPVSYSLNFTAENVDFIAEYKIGSKDGKSRSGILKLGENIYQETLKIKPGTSLKISKAKDNKYIIERL